ncbi:tetratricopeptide repeat protein [bacterium]|nr:tetratricopeptide repeat protein [bacterium]
MFDELFEDLTPEETENKIKTEKLSEGERRIVSILFADIKGFTSLSEKLDSEQVKTIVDKLLKLFTNCIERHGGYVDKYEGDLVMGLFGAKSANENDTERAIQTALEMLEKFKLALKKIPLTKEINVELGLRIGIDTGLVTTSKIGLGREGDFTIYGDAVNLASRMESNAPVNRIMVTEEIHKLAQDWFDFEDEKEIEVKGKSKKAKTFLVKSIKAKKLPKWLQHKRSVFVGRETELNFLENAYQTVLKNLNSKQGDFKPIVVGLKGVAGLGKSRLAYEFLKSKLQNQPQKNLSAKGFCSNVSTGPYLMFLTLIKNYLGITLLDPVELIRKKLEDGFKNLEFFLEKESEKKNLREALPMIGYLFGLKYEDVRFELKGKDLQINVQISIRYFLETASFCANKFGFPFVVVFEDLHWMDESSTSTLNFLLQTLNLEERRENKPLNQFLFILLYRPEYEVHKEIKIESDFKETELTAFDEKTSMLLIETILGGITIPEKNKTLLLEKSSGNPFYIEEWIEFVKSKGTVIFEEDGSQTLNETEIPVPQSLSALIHSRLDSLKQEQKVLLQKASVIGREFSVQLLTEVEKRFGETIEGLPTKLSELENMNFIRLLTNLPEHYVFNHVMTQEVAYNSFLRRNRKILHKIIAESIEEKYKDVLSAFYSELANRYEKAEEKEKAIEFLQKAGEQAKENFENQKAIEFYDRLLRNLKETVNRSDLETDTLLGKGKVLELIGKWDEAEEFFKEAVDLSEKIKDKKRLASSYKFLGGTLYLKGDYDKAMECFEKALKISKEIGDKSGISVTVRNMGGVYFNKADYCKAMKYFEKSLKISEEIGDKRGISRVFGSVGSVYFKKGEYYKAMEYSKKSLQISEEIGDKRGILREVGVMGAFYFEKGDYVKAMEYFEKSLQISEEIGDKRGISVAVRSMGVVYFEKGDYVKAMKCFEKSLQISEEIRDKSGISVAVGNIGIVYLEKGDCDKAMECLEKALKISEEIRDKSGISVAVGNMGDVYLEKGDYVKAMECYEKSLQISEEIRDKSGISYAVGNMGVVYKDKGNYDKAMECYEKAIKIPQESGMKSLLCGQLNKKVELLLLLERFDEAKILNSESSEIAKGLGNENEIFNSKVLSEKINFALGDKENPPKQLTEMLSKTKDTERTATLNYELWKMNQGEKFKNEALKLYRELYLKKPKFEFKKKTEELERQE